MIIKIVHKRHDTIIKFSERPLTWQKKVVNAMKEISLAGIERIEVTSDPDKNRPHNVFAVATVKDYIGVLGATSYTSEWEFSFSRTVALIPTIKQYYSSVLMCILNLVAMTLSLMHMGQDQDEEVPKDEEAPDEHAD